MMPDWISELRFTDDGLLPAILQDVSTREVLMMGWMNREALLKTAETGQVWFWSRSRQELWHKGATSGNTQNVKRLSYDCDQDTLLIEVAPDGPACHTGEVSCFYRTAIGEQNSSQAGDSQKNAVQTVPAGTESGGSESMAALTQLLEIVRSRYEERPEGAYTTYLFEKGTDKIVKKIGEEATEVVVAAKNRDAEELICEAGDLIYHLFVLLQNEGVPFSRVTQELQRRHGLADQRGKTK